MTAVCAARTRPVSLLGHVLGGCFAGRAARATGCQCEHKQTVSLLQINSTRVLASALFQSLCWCSLVWESKPREGCHSPPLPEGSPCSVIVHRQRTRLAFKAPVKRSRWVSWPCSCLLRQCGQVRTLLHFVLPSLTRQETTRFSTNSGCQTHAGTCLPRQPCLGRAAFPAREAWSLGHCHAFRPASASRAARRQTVAVRFDHAPNCWQCCAAVCRCCAMPW